MIYTIIGVAIYVVIGSFSAGVVFYILFDEGKCDDLQDMAYGPVWVGFLWPIFVPFITAMWIVSRILNRKSSNRRGDKKQ